MIYFFKKISIKKEGFTLVEMIIYVAIIGIVISGFISFGLSISKSRNKAYSLQEVQANSNIALDFITRKIRQAEDVVSPAAGATSSSLILDMPDAAPGSSFILNSGVLRFVEGSTSTAITSDETAISDLIFTNLANSGDRDNIKIEITIQYRNAPSIEYAYIQSMHTAVSLRY